MEPILIAHLTDLHFGDKGEDKAIWNQLVAYLNDVVRPHLVLVTGDIVNTPDAVLFERAKDQLDQLRPRSEPQFRYRVCPGNHDRFWLGNNAGKLSWMRRFLSGRDGNVENLARPLHGELEKSFKGGLVLTPDLPLDLTLEAGDDQSGTHRWSLRVLGCDSCENDTYFAQGLLSVDSISKLRTAALGNTDVDLVILMIHHHLLPIASLEQEQPDFKSLANVTGMLNSSTALNMLAASHVNVVLHGHEHHRQVSRFRTFDTAHGEIAVVAGGSSTGTKTLEGWAIKRARFNILELRPDRKVVLREIDGSKGYFAESNEPPVELLDAEDVRRARFHRKAAKIGVRNPPRSRLTKLLEFRADRDAMITENRTDWLIGDRWVMHTQNRTGTPTTAYVEMEFKDGQHLQLRSDFVRTGLGDNSYSATFRLDGHSGRSVRRISTSWSWEAGAVLTRDELATIRDPGEFRIEGKEFASVQAPESDLEELTLVVKMPAEFSPNPRSMEVWTFNIDKSQWEPNVPLRYLVEPLGQGLFSVRVPFPLPRWHYALCWPMAATVGMVAEKWVQYLNDNAATVHAAICQELFGAGGLPDDATVALYVRRENSNGLHCAQSQGKTPQSLSFDEQSGIVRGAWWGRRSRTAAPEGSETSGLFVDGDSYMALVPLLPPDDESAAAAGLVRVSVRSRFPDLAQDDQAQVQALRSAIVRVPWLWYCHKSVH